MVEHFFVQITLHVMGSELYNVKGSIARQEAEIVTICFHDIGFGGDILSNEPLRRSINYEVAMLINVPSSEVI